MTKWVELTEDDDLPEGADGWVIARTDIGTSYSQMAVHGYRKTTAAPNPPAEPNLALVMEATRRNRLLPGIETVYVIRQVLDAHRT
jgi:hypothetical protein